MSILDQLDDDERAALLQELQQRQGTPDPDFEPGEEQSTETRSAVARNAEVGRPQPDNVYDRAAAEYDGDIAKGATNEEALARYISKVNYYAMSDDPRYRDQVDARNHQG